MFNIFYQKLSKDKEIIIKFWLAISGKYDFLWNISPVVDQYLSTTYFLKMCSIFAGSPDFGRKYERKKSILDQLNKENYLMSSYSPPGGIKEIACSVSNLLSLTNIDLTRKIRRIKSTSGALTNWLSGACKIRAIFLVKTQNQTFRLWR